VLQALVTSNALRDDMATGQAVTVRLPTESLRVLASSNGNAPVALAEDAPAVAAPQP
jgi:hypothetical protein